MDSADYSGEISSATFGWSMTAAQDIATSSFAAPSRRFLTRSLPRAAGTKARDALKRKLGAGIDADLAAESAQFAVLDQYSVSKLKSGGPLMTVEELVGDGEYKCVWFDGKTKKTDVFKEEVLKPASGGMVVGSVERG